MKILFSPAQTRHDPTYQVIEGVRQRYPETPERVRAILDALDDPRYTIVEPLSFPMDALHRVHAPEYLRFIMKPVAVEAVVSRDDAAHFGDDYVAIASGTAESAVASAHAALTAAALVAEGERAVYALCRPPGHHAGPNYCGGFCFLNNAALAAEALASVGAKVSILDIDYHHGNGTQDIFYESGAVQFVSIHSDPEHEYPYRAGFAEETGRGRGLGLTVNLPLPRGAGEGLYFDAFERGLEAVARFRPDAMVVSFGADICRGDPEGFFDLDPGAIGRMGGRIVATGLPQVIVQEGGYVPEVLAEAVRSFLGAFE